MASEARSLESICSLIVDCPHSTPVWTDSGYVVLRNQNIKNGRLDLSEPSFTDAEHFAGRNRRAKPTGGDIVITREAPMGDVCMVPDGLECCLGQRQVLLRPNPKLVNPQFLLYALQSSGVQHQIGWNEGTGSTVSNLRIPVLKALAIPTPCRSLQDEVAEILGALDDQIDNLRQINVTLEAIAQALFKSWFVDFDPVRAKADGREPEGMDAATAALFPSEFEDSELGPIPKGWRTTRVGDVVTVVKGRSYKSSELQDSDTALVTLKSFNRGGGFRRDGFKPYVGPHKEEQVLNEGDCIVAFTDVTQQAELIGRSAIVTGSEDYRRLVASLDVGILRPKAKSLTSGFLRSLLSGDRYVSHIKAFVTGTTVLHLAKDGVPSFMFVMPPDEVINRWTEIGEACSYRQALSVRKIDLLTQLRDTLLPRLISGKLRLPEVSAFVDEVTA